MSASCCCSRVATKLPLGLREVEERGLADIGDSLFVLGPALVHTERGFIHSGVQLVAVHKEVHAHADLAAQVDLFLPVRFYWVRRARWLKLHRHSHVSQA